MFTGIIEEVGTLRESTPRGGGHLLRVACTQVIEDLQPGGSIAVNGACLTATEVSPQGLTADLSPETVNRSSLSRLALGAAVNLERSLRMSDRLEGHLVTGHIDGVGTARSIRRTGEHWEIEYGAAPEILRYVVEKGSVAVDGISLTVAGTGPDSFRVAIIPETVRRTNVSRLSVGEPVNIECDLIAKYVERFLNHRSLSDEGITMEQLREHGFA